MKARIRRISRGQVSAKNKGKIDGLSIVDGTEIPEDQTTQLAAELSLEKMIAQLKQEHRQVLGRLHEEIDRLKRQNQELQFVVTTGDVNEQGRNAAISGHRRLQNDKPSRLRSAVEKNGVYATKKVRPRGSGGLHSATSANQNQEILAVAGANKTNAGIASLEKAVNELKRILKDEKCQNIQLITKLAKENASKMPHESEKSLTYESTETLTPHSKKTSEKSHVEGSCPLPFNATLEPFLVHNLRPPTAEECETIIKTLKERAEKQSHEITSIRTDLKDVIVSHKLTPESYLLAKYYAQETFKCGGVKKSMCKQRKSSGKQPAVVSLPDRHLLPAEKVGVRIRRH